MKSLRWLIIIMGILLITSTAYANDALSHFFARGAMTFTFGIIWVLMSELGYCLYRFRHTSVIRNVSFVVIANAITTLMGFVLLMLASDDYNILWLYLSSGITMFIVDYICTVPIEALILKRFLRNSEKLSYRVALKHALIFNVLSYIGLIIIYYVLLSGENVS